MDAKEETLIFERLTVRSRRVLVLAEEEARVLRHGYVGTEHLLLGLLREGEGVAAVALQASGLELEVTRKLIIERAGPATQTTDHGAIPFSPRVKKVFELALREALQLGHDYIGAEHLLLGLLREGQGVAVTVLVADLHLELASIGEHVRGQLTETDRTRARPTPGPVERSGIPAGMSLDQPFDEAEVALLAHYVGATAEQIRVLAWLTKLKIYGRG